MLVKIQWKSVNCNTRTERVVQSSNLVALFRVVPPAVSNNERDLGLYSHCFGSRRSVVMLMFSGLLWLLRH